MSERVVARYVGGGGFYYQIPRRDLTEADWERLTEEQRAVVKGSALYEMVPAVKKARARTDESVTTNEEKKDGE